MKNIVMNILKKYKWYFLISTIFIMLNMYFATYPSMIVGWIIDFLYNIEENIIPTLTENQKLYAYANEADILNVALFGMTAKEWKDKNPNLEGNMRDYANILQLVILSNLENLNSEMISQGLKQKERLERLNEIAKKQYTILQDNKGIKRLENLENTPKLE